MDKIMPRIERTIEINAPIQRIWDVLDDHSDYARWNITVNEVSEIGPKEHYFKTTVGDFTNYQQDQVPLESMWSKQEGGPMNAIGYTFETKDDVVEVTIWCEFEIEDLAPIMEMAGDILLKSVKTYVEFLEAGGDPEDFQKK
jgi:uncharacterized protein YndB with AHSA1/START domain